MPDLPRTAKVDVRALNKYGCGQFFLGVTQSLRTRIVVDDSEATQAGGFFGLDPRSVRVERIVGCIVIAFISLAMVIGLLIAAFVEMGFGWLWFSCVGAAIVVSGLMFWFVIAWPKKEHRFVKWKWDENGLEIHRGVYWRHQVTVPVSRIQHVDVSQGPLQRQYGLAKLTLHTAGTQEAAVELSGIAFETATWLRERLMTQQGVEDAV